MHLVPDQRSADGPAVVGGATSRSPGATASLEELFLQAYHRLHGRVLDHAERFLSKEDARDAVGDAMEDLWRRWPVLTPEQRNDKYVFGVVHYSVFAKLRVVDPLVSLDDAEPELDQHALNGLGEFVRADTAADVLDLVLAAMPPRRREVFLLVREERFSYKEAAEILGLSLGTIKTHMRLATQDLHAAFTRAGFRISGAPQAQLPSPTGDDIND